MKKTRRRAMVTHKRTHSSAPHRHSKAECLKILRNLSTYLDDESTTDVCREIRAHLGACPNCELFLNSLRETITLCRHAEPPPLSPTLKARLRRQILNAIAKTSST
jgi:hypothetical protein